MRTVVKSVIRCLSASISSVSSTAMNREDFTGSQPMFDGRRPHQQSEVISIVSAAEMNNQNEVRSQSLSSSYKLHANEEEILNKLLDLEYEYYPDNSSRGSYIILDMAQYGPSYNTEENVSGLDVRNMLNVVRFINTVVFAQDAFIYFLCANYLNRLLNKKSVKKNLMPFIITALYDLAVEQRLGKALTDDQLNLMFYLYQIPTNHIEDFNRMKLLLIEKLNGDLKGVTVLDYLKLFLKASFDHNGVSNTYSQLIHIAMVLATSTELTYFTLSCQALSLVNLAARHIMLDYEIKSKFSHELNNIPLIFLSPTRLIQFANFASISEESIKHCSESIIRYYSFYYEKQPLKCLSVKFTKDNKNEDQIINLYTIPELPESNVLSNNSFKINDLIVKLNKVSVENNQKNEPHKVTSKQKRRLLRQKKKLKRQIHEHCNNIKQKSVIVDDGLGFSSSEKAVFNYD